MEFQIKQNYGEGSLAFVYFTATGSESIDELKKMAQKAAMDDWKQVNPSLYLFSAPKPPRPTIEVAEYKDGKKVKNGIRFKTRWR